MAVKGAGHWSKAACWLSLIGIILLAAMLRLNALGATSLWGDEINVAVVSRKGLAELLLGARSHISAPPLDYLVVHLLLTRLGDSEFILRFGAALWGIASVPLAYLLGRRLGGRPAGLAAALLLAVSPLHVGFSRQAKFYAALVFFTLLSDILFLRALDARQRPGAQQWRAWAAYAACNVVGIYFHPFIALVLIAQGALVLLLWVLSTLERRLTRPRLRGSVARPPFPLPFLLCAAATALAFAPWFLWDMATQEPLGAYHTRLDLDLGAQIALAPAGGEPWTAGLLAGLVLLGVVLKPSSRGRDARSLLLLHLALIPAVVWLDNVGGYWFSPKQVLFALPAWLVLAAAGLAALGRRVARMPARPAVVRPAGALAFGAVVLALVAAGAIAAAAGWYQPRQDWRGVADYLEAQVRPGDQIIQLWWLQPFSLAWYLSPIPDVAMIKAHELNTTPLDLKPGSQVWWIVVHQGHVSELRTAVGDAFDVAVFDWLAVLRLKDGVADAQQALGATLSLLQVQGALSPSDAAWYEALVANLCRTGGYDLARSLLEQGDAQAAASEWAAAVRSYAQAVQAWPGWGMAHTRLANAYRAQEKLDLAEVEYRRSMEVEPGYVGAYLNLGAIYQAQGREDESLALYERGVEADPDSAWAHSTLGSAYLARGNSSEALAHLQRAVELEPGNIAWLLVLANAYRELGRNDEAIAAYRQVLAQDPGNAKAAEALRVLGP